MKPQERIVGSYLRLFKQLISLMERAEKKLSPAQYRLLDRQAEVLVTELGELQKRHVEFVDHLLRELRESNPPPPSRPRRSSRPPPRTLDRFTLHPARTPKKS